MTHSPSALEADVFKKLSTSGMFSQYEDAFRCATGLPLRIVRWDEEFCLGEHRDNQSPFCEILNKCKVACRECVETNRRLLEESERVDGPMTCGCFSGLCATAVPVKLGKTTVGFLKTGQVFRRQPTEEDFARVMDKLQVGDSDRKALHDAYFQTKQIDPKRYDSMITLLEMFADQLSKHAETVSVVVDGSEPEGIARARKMIHRQLEDPISFSELAKVAGMSESHFCRTFKDITTMTVTEYTTRARIAWARKELLRPVARVSEIAYQVGFQSLSQFNRSFSKIVGCSPTSFRKRELEKANLVAR